jgi:hypothetical protein
MISLGRLRAVILALGLLVVPLAIRSASGAAVALLRERAPAALGGVPFRPLPADPAPFAFCAARSPALVDGTVRDEAVMASMILALAPEERARLAELLDNANARWEARANPLLEDLGAGDPDAELVAWLAGAPAAVSVAMAASRATFCAADGYCAAPADARGACPAGFSPVTGDDGRARFLAWPFGHALRLRADTAEHARAAADALRVRARGRTHIGLVVQSPAADEDDLRARLIRHETLKGVVERRGDGALGGATQRLALDARDVVVIPRLDALAAREELADEVRAAAYGLASPR